MARREAVELKVRRSNHWTQVYAEAQGRDVSHLGYTEARLQVGKNASVRMATIGGVGTEKTHRRRGLAQEVLARALEEIRRDGFTAAGLYTSRSIVAHRLYRRFGFVDVWRRRPAFKIINHPLMARRALASLVTESAELQSRRLHISLKLNPPSPIHLRIEGNDLCVLSRAPRQIDLLLTMSDMTFMRLCHREIGLEQARTAKLVRCTGDSSTYELLKRALCGRRDPIDEE